jgi:small-conductance mechanosensitive channel
MFRRGSAATHTIAQALTWWVTGLIWAIAITSILARFGLPFTSLVLPVTVIGAALGIGAQKVVADLLNGIFIISERQYAFGRISEPLIQLALSRSER